MSQNVSISSIRDMEGYNLVLLQTYTMMQHYTPYAIQCYENAPTLLQHFGGQILHNLTTQAIRGNYWVSALGVHSESFGALSSVQKRSRTLFISAPDFESTGAPIFSSFERPKVEPEKVYGEAEFWPHCRTSYVINMHSEIFKCNMEIYSKLLMDENSRLERLTRKSDGFRHCIGLAEALVKEGLLKKAIDIIEEREKSKDFFSSSTNICPKTGKHICYERYKSLLKNTQHKPMVEQIKMAKAVWRSFPIICDNSLCRTLAGPAATISTYKGRPFTKSHLMCAMGFSKHYRIKMDIKPEVICRDAVGTFFAEILVPILDILKQRLPVLKSGSKLLEKSDIGLFGEIWKDLDLSCVANSQGHIEFKWSQSQFICQSNLNDTFSPIFNSFSSWMSSTRMANVVYTGDPSLCIGPKHYSILSKLEYSKQLADSKNNYWYLDQLSRSKSGNVKTLDWTKINEHSSLFTPSWPVFQRCGVTTQKYHTYQTRKEQITTIFLPPSDNICVRDMLTIKLKCPCTPLVVAQKENEVVNIWTDTQLSNFKESGLENTNWQFNFKTPRWGDFPAELLLAYLKADKKVVIQLAEVISEDTPNRNILFRDLSTSLPLQSPCYKENNATNTFYILNGLWYLQVKGMCTKHSSTNCHIIDSGDNCEIVLSKINLLEYESLKKSSIHKMPNFLNQEMAYVHTEQGIFSPKFHHKGCAESENGRWKLIDCLCSSLHSGCPARDCFENSLVADPWPKYLRNYLELPNDNVDIIKVLDFVESPFGNITIGKYPTNGSIVELQETGMMYLHVEQFLPIILYNYLGQIPFSNKWSIAQTIRKDNLAIKTHLAAACGKVHNEVGPGKLGEISSDQFPTLTPISNFITKRLLQLLDLKDISDAQNLDLNFKNLYVLLYLSELHYIPPHAHIKPSDGLKYGIIVGVTIGKENGFNREIKITAADPNFDPLHIHGRIFKCSPNSAFIMMFPGFLNTYYHEVVHNVKDGIPFKDDIDLKLTFVWQI